MAAAGYRREGAGAQTEGPNDRNKASIPRAYGVSYSMKMPVDFANAHFGCGSNLVSVFPMIEYNYYSRRGYEQ